SAWQAHPRPQAAAWRRLQRDLAAVAARHVAGDGEAEAGAATVRIALRLEAVEGLEDDLPLVRRDAGTVVVDQHLDPPCRDLQRDRHLRAVHQSVLDQVGERAPEGRGAKL